MPGLRHAPRTQLFRMEQVCSLPSHPSSHLSVSSRARLIYQCSVQHADPFSSIMHMHHACRCGTFELEWTCGRHERAKLGRYDAHAVA